MSVSAVNCNQRNMITIILCPRFIDRPASGLMASDKSSLPKVHYELHVPCRGLETAISTIDPSRPSGMHHPRCEQVLYPRKSAVVPLRVQRQVAERRARDNPRGAGQGRGTPKQWVLIISFTGKANGSRAGRERGPLAGRACICKKIRARRARSFDVSFDAMMMSGDFTIRTREQNRPASGLMASDKSSLSKVHYKLHVPCRGLETAISTINPSRPSGMHHPRCEQVLYPRKSAVVPLRVQRQVAERRARDNPRGAGQGRGTPTQWVRMIASTGQTNGSRAGRECGPLAGLACICKKNRARRARSFDVSFDAMMMSAETLLYGQGNKSLRAEVGNVNGDPAYDSEL
ncbi:hypothetical protein GGX14DRAFT_390402 [Mycena pura]|uniref:Uncharacterized protein n=1 Tax=Mycena pura TaxID=153505 RepID=A0AAD6VP33_9AGAR|nr:hypothetical protein GGX14DRAFT_390402 [Mycena pura]